MTVAFKRDNNGVTVIGGVLNTDGATPIPVKATPSTHIMDVSDGTTGTVNASADARRDDNQVTTLLALSKNNDGVKVELAVNSSGQLLIQST